MILKLPSGVGNIARQHSLTSPAKSKKRDFSNPFLIKKFQRKIVEVRDEKQK